MNTYAQNKEDLAIGAWFGDYKGTLLEVGANDGQTFSNSLALIEVGWGAWLLEPVKGVFEKLKNLHLLNRKVWFFNTAIGESDGEETIMVSGSIMDKGDASLVSTLCFSDYEKWKDHTDFTPERIKVRTWESFWRNVNLDLDFISIDAEGMDLSILKQINLSGVGCKCLLIEHNGNAATEWEITKYAASHGLTNILLRNAENICLTV
jgi:FkbM family methyltransferase